VRLDLSWGIQDTDDNFVAGTAFSSYTEQLQGNTGSGDIVAAMGRLFDQFAADIAAASTKLTTAE
jgi:hypothetical protein